MATTDQLAQPIYRAAIVGCGRIAGLLGPEKVDEPGLRLLPHSHAGAYAAHPRTQLVAAADPSAERLATFGETWGIPTEGRFADYRAMLEQVKPDVVSIASPSRLHRELLLGVLEFPVKAVFLEKPISISLAEADEMIGRVRQAGVPVAINHTRTYDPWFRRGRDLIVRGAIGDLHSVQVTWVDGLSFGGSHLFDALRFLIGAEVAWVFGHLDESPMKQEPYWWWAGDPAGSGYLVFENGVRVFVNATMGKAAGTEIDVIGSTGRIKLGGVPEMWSIVPIGDSEEMVEREFPGRSDGKSGMVGAVDQLVAAIDATATGVTYPKIGSTVQDGRKALEIIVALHRSHQRKAPIHLPLGAEDLDYRVEAL